MPPLIDILFTDLDGTLLEEGTYAFDQALPAIRELQRLQVPIIFCTSKTFPETLAIQAALGVTDPFIVENGGAIYFRPGQLDPGPEPVKARGAWHCLELGLPRTAVLERLDIIRQTLGDRFRGFSQMEPEEIAERCGLPIEEARWASLREFDEPIRMVSGDPVGCAQLEWLAAAQGLTVTEGGRFRHVAGGSDKGRAVRRVLEFFARGGRNVVSVGVGDSPNDIFMLGSTTWPILVKRPGGSHDARVLDALPRVRRAEGVGPAGWNAAVLALIGTGEAGSGSAAPCMGGGNECS